MKNLISLAKNKISIGTFLFLTFLFSSVSVSAQNKKDVNDNSPVEFFLKFQDENLQKLLEKTGYRYVEFIGQESIFSRLASIPKFSDSVFIFPSYMRENRNQIMACLKEYNNSDFLRKYNYFILDSTLRKSILLHSHFQENLLKSRLGVFYAKEDQLAPTVEPRIITTRGIVLRKDYIFTDMNFISKNFNVFYNITFSRFDENQKLKKVQEMILNNENYKSFFSEPIFFCNYSCGKPYMYKHLYSCVDLYTQKQNKKEKEIGILMLNWDEYPNYKIEIMYNVWGLPDHIELEIKEDLTDEEIIKSINALSDKISEIKSDIMSIAKYGERLKIVPDFPQ